MNEKTTLDGLPNGAMARCATICGSLDFSKSTLWRLVKAGKFPKPVKLSERVTAWRVGDVRDWLNARAAA